MIKIYIEYLKRKIKNDDFCGRYRYLLAKLNDIEFYSDIPNDKLLIANASQLRCSYEGKCPDGPVTVLEILVTLAMNLETNVMHKDPLGDRTGIWFAEMINNLGLYEQDDEHFNPDHVDFVISRFLNKEYELCESGNIVVFATNNIDTKKTTLWNQLSWYYSEIFF